MDSMLTGALIGAGTALVVMVIMIVLRKPVKCAACGREQPKVRKPANMEQAMWGGYTCVGCGANLDAKGNVKAK